MILYTYLKFSLLALVCKVFGHRLEGPKLYKVCRRCRAQLTLRYTRHQGQRERARRMTRMIRGKVPDAQIQGGRMTVWSLQAAAARVRAKMRAGEV